VTRNPVPVPELDCFGLAYDPNHAICAGCEFKPDCRAMCGERVKLSKATFRTVPKKLKAKDKAVQVGNLVVKRSTVEGAYRRCIYAVYGDKWPCSGVGKHWEDIVLNAKAAHMPLETFIGITVLAYKITHPDTVFPLNMLTAESSIDRVATYEKLCREKYGYTNLESLGFLVNEDTTTIEKELLHSEIVVGRFVVGWRLKVGSPPYEELYDQNELTLSPYWLATEETYTKTILTDYAAQEAKGTDAQIRHRAKTLQTHGLLKRRKTLARTVFEAKSNVMSTAVDHVLRFYGYSADDFLVENTPIKDTMKMWNTLGLALLHLECYRAVNSEPHKLWR
jgi:hypothetical protein